MRDSAREVNGMSMSHTAGQDAAATCEAPSDGSMRTEEVNGVAVPTPFEPHSPEADALRGAISFLSSLIAFYDELIESGSFGAGDPAGSGSSPIKAPDVDLESEEFPRGAN